MAGPLGLGRVHLCVPWCLTKKGVTCGLKCPIMLPGNPSEVSCPPASSGQMKGAMHRHVGGFQGGPEPAEGGREQREEADCVTWERGPSESTHLQTVARGQGSRWAPRTITLSRATPPLTLDPCSASSVSLFAPCQPHTGQKL